MPLIFFSVIILYLSNLISPHAHTSSEVEAEIVIRNIKDPKGILVVSVYDNDIAFPKVGKEIFTEKVTVSDTLPHTVKIKVPREGWYAIAMFQDEYGTGKIKQDKVGIPEEPYAFSNNIHPKVEAPSFSSCKFYIRKDDKSIVEIRLIQPRFHGKL